MNRILLILTTLGITCFSFGQGTTITSPVNWDPSTCTIGNSKLIELNLQPTSGTSAQMSILSNNWDLGGGFGLINGDNVVSPIAWMYDYGGRNAFTIARKSYSGGQGPNVLGEKLTALFQVRENGNVGIGTTTPDAKLAVKGQVHANEVKVDLTVPGPDYVFEKDYKLTSLEEIKNYIDQNKHLPEIPSAKEMEKNGVQLGEMNMLLLKKIEELTLYMIEQQKN